MTKLMFRLAGEWEEGSGLQLVPFSALATICLVLAVTGCAGPGDATPQKSPHAALWEMLRRAEREREQGMKSGAAESPAGTEASSPSSSRGASSKSNVMIGGER